LPNWRSAEFPLRTYFPPGSRFSYSGEAFVYLQSMIECLTGEPLEAAIKQLVLDPFGMDASSFVWRDAFAENVASPHDHDGKIGAKYMPAEANAASSLHTTSGDYGRFLVAAMDGLRLKEATAKLWLPRRFKTPKGRTKALDVAAPETERGIAWGLGWGLEPDVGAFFHWGRNPGATAFVLAAPAERRALVVFINSSKASASSTRLRMTVSRS
jgi:CubicO group peptidase (beta-lactamase class C family)